jgi:dienelactone hydrolase
MTSQLLTSTTFPELQPTLELDERAETAARYPFTATTRAEAEAWQIACRAAVAQTVGFLDDPVVLPEPQEVEEIDRGDFVRRKVIIRTAEHARMPVYLLVPKGATGPLPVVIAYAGHGYGVKDIVGLWEDGSERLEPDGYHKDFGIALCRRGFLVAAPEIACFGERQTDYSHLDHVLGEPQPTTCHNAATYAFMLGKSMVGMRVRDGMRLIDYLGTLPEANTGRMGAMGISGGGMLTFFHTMLDTRIRACVVSGYYSSFRDSILAMNHCTCNFVPGLLNIGEMQDLVGLILPRPILVEAGTRDPIFPITTVRASVDRARHISEVLGGDPNTDVELDEFEGRHSISGRRAYDFLWQHLTAS